MTMLAREQLFPYDVALFDQMGQIGAQRGRAQATAPAYGQMGGMAFQRRGEMYGSLFDAAQRAHAARAQEEMARRARWNEAAARKQAMAKKMQAQAASNFVSGVADIGMGLVSEAASDPRNPNAEKLSGFLTDSYSGRWSGSPKWDAESGGWGR